MITIIDYGMGNLRSVSKAIEHLGGKVRVSSKPEDIGSSDKVILPGVGAFGKAMDELNSKQLIDPIRSFVNEDKPFLGICLGLQLLFEKSEESPGVRGLGLLKGSVERFKTRELKIPHMGWNTVTTKDSVFLKEVPQDSFFYFVHTYYANPNDSSCTLGSCSYGDETFAAIVGKNNLFATQFHPEKSQEIGLQILRNFIHLS